MEYAMASGALAARTILKAREAGSFSAEHLALYRRLLEESFVLKDFENFKHAPKFLKTRGFLVTIRSGRGPFPGPLRCARRPERETFPHAEKAPTFFGLVAASERFEVVDEIMTPP